MAIKNCNECGKEVSTKAKTCPHCGAPQGPKQYGCGTLIVIGLVIAAFSAVLSVGGGEQTGSPSVQSTTTQKANAKENSEQKKKKYVGRLNKELVSLDKFNVESYTKTKESIVICLGIFSAWASLAEEAKGKSLDKTEHETLSKFKKKASAIQSKSLPRLRDAYGVVIKDTLWEHDMSARTFGAGYRTIEFIGATFAANKHIKEFHGGIHSILTRLRFSRANYKWYKQADEYTYYTIASYNDSVLVIWGENDLGRVVK